ncbi:hypothetical protein EG329_012642 [Mollisiaceae sp. DMI_Dod_QoI]|nr:hypothetical protein EG329_012642 [Helotiales sp. DMI_Dod_QoI]
MSYLCGCYYYVSSTDFYTRMQKNYLPLLNSEVHSTILSTTSRTVLKQTFTNPSTLNAIKECIYTFPLYDGVSVVSFTCRIGKKVLTGLVKEKAKAQEIFDQAVAKGETAGLLEQAPEASDVFSTKLGNIPAGESIIVEITYIGELKHHETEGIRFTIPTKIAPRYGSGPSHGFGPTQGFSSGGDNGEIKIVVDVNMPEGSFIKGVQSPSHPIAVSMGTISTATEDQPTMSKASATLSLGSAALEKDFILIVQSKDVGTPKAILETHPTIRGHRALMATLVPKFSLPPSRSEIVFVADRSGSMAGNIEMLVSAMKVFLKSLPQGVKFNICSFGSRHSFLWDKSQSNSRETLAHATSHLSSFAANLGGTETFGAIRGTVERRFKDIPLEIILLTDGDIHSQNDLFAYVNRQVEETKGNVRVFPLGIGNGVSHSLIEGLARAGNGFAQAVQHGERLDNAVVRMLRGALSPHITDYTLEVKYENEDDSFELIDRVTEGMKVLLTDDTKSLKSPPSTSPKPTISLFDSSSEPEKITMKGLSDSSFYLPSIPTPKLLQAPHKIPSLFSFSRTTVYLLMSPETIQRNPTAVVLRGTSEHGPLALEIPIETLSSPAETIHQLAAKKAVQDLEEGRGWIYDAKDQNGILVKDKYPSCFDDLVQREAVRLGEKFQIAGKWCSFVAVAANDEEISKKKQISNEPTDFAEEVDDLEEYDLSSFKDNFVEDLPPYRPGAESAIDFSFPSRNNQPSSPPPPASTSFGMFRNIGHSRVSSSNPAPMVAGTAFGGAALMSSQPTSYRASSSFQGSPNPSYSPSAFDLPTPSVKYAMPPAPSTVNPSFGLNSAIPPPPPQPQTAPNIFAASAAPASQQNLFPTQHMQQMSQQQFSGPQSRSRVMPQQVASSSLFGSPTPAPSPGCSPGSHFGFSSDPSPKSRRSVGGAAPRMQLASKAARKSAPSPPARDSYYDGEAGMKKKKKLVRGRREITPDIENVDEDEDNDMETELEVDWSSKSAVEKVLALIDLQDFDGFWSLSDSVVEKILGIKIEIDGPGSEEDIKLGTTIFVIKFLEVKCGAEEGTWELVVEKARNWIQGLGRDQAELSKIEQVAEMIVKGN